MKANYERIENIKVDIQNADIEEIVKLDTYGRYGFYKCEACSGPILGHLEVKCRALNGVRYDPVTEKSFKDWLERISEFRVAMVQRERKKEAKQAENQAEKLGEAVKAIMDGLQPTAQPTAQPRA